MVRLTREHKFVIALVLIFGVCWFSLLFDNLVHSADCKPKSIFLRLIIFMINMNYSSCYTKNFVLCPPHLLSKHQASSFQNPKVLKSKPSICCFSRYSTTSHTSTVDASSDGWDWCLWNLTLRHIRVLENTVCLLW